MKRSWLVAQIVGAVLLILMTVLLVCAPNGERCLDAVGSVLAHLPNLGEFAPLGGYAGAAQIERIEQAHGWFREGTRYQLKGGRQVTDWGHSPLPDAQVGKWLGWIERNPHRITEVWIYTEPPDVTHVKNGSSN